MKNKRKVYYACGRESQDIPKILLEGKWLKEYDFHIGDTYQLIAEKGKIVITKEYEN